MSPPSRTHVRSAPDARPRLLEARYPATISKIRASGKPRFLRAGPRYGPHPCPLTHRNLSVILTGQSGSRFRLFIDKLLQLSHTGHLMVLREHFPSTYTAEYQTTKFRSEISGSSGRSTARQTPRVTI